MPSIADVVDEIAEALPGVTVKLGREFQEENESPPRVVFIPRDFRFGPPRARDRNRFHTPSVATRSVGIEARIWGAALEAVEAVEADPDADPPVEAVEGYDPGTYPELRATELLMDKVVMAIHANTVGSVEFEPGEVVDTGAAHHGRLFSLRFRIELPVVPTDDDALVETTTFTDVASIAGTPVGDPAHDPIIPASTTVTVELAEEETASPSP